MAYNEIEQLTEKGVVGVWTHGFYDGWAPNYMFYVANGHQLHRALLRDLRQLVSRNHRAHLAAIGNIPHVVPSQPAPAESEVVVAQ